MILAVASAMVLAGCGGDDEEDRAADRNATRPAMSQRPERSVPTLPRVRCPASKTNCAAASGRILYVERVDPDGDGDAHFVLLSDDSVTAPGVSVIDVRPALRPQPLPGPGDYLSAAGPVFTGSFGQRQIEADVLRFVRR